MQHRLFRFGFRLTKAIEAISAVLLAAVIVMNLSQIFFRYVLVDPLSWSEEAMRYSTTWMVMLAGSAALFRDEHMAINLLGENGPDGLRRALRLLVLGTVAGFCALLMWEGFPAALNNFRQVSPAVRIPMALPYLAIPVGATLMFLKAVILMFLPDELLAELRADGETA